MSLYDTRINALVWGISIALSWTWGLGLFFAVQMALQFGLGGLLCFVIPNALGLILFGYIVQHIAHRYQDAQEFEQYFFTAGLAFRYVILVYQIVAVTLTFFTVFRYILQPLGVSLGLSIPLVLGITLFWGGQFDITRIKWSHLGMFGGVVVAIAGIVAGFVVYLSSPNLLCLWNGGKEPLESWLFLGYLIPLVTGLTLGPWLDIQQWQRAIQLYREQTSIQTAYLWGGLLFLGILLFHGLLALWVFSVGGSALVLPAYDGLFHAKDAIVRFLLLRDFQDSRLFTYGYLLFLGLCILSTLDSSYVSLQWYLKKFEGKNRSFVLTLLMDVLLVSPTLLFSLMVMGAVAAVSLHFELEYFMVFYGSFSVGYTVVFLLRLWLRSANTSCPQQPLFSVALCSLGLFGFGYFNRLWWLMACGTLLPLVHGIVLFFAYRPEKNIPISLEQPQENDRRRQETNLGFQANVAAQPTSGYFDDKWFCYTFMSTYQDTNSVGNVYFAMYVLWVGKVREMFFHACMPNFDLKTTSFFILTRQLEHTFLCESKEFDLITVKIHIQRFNRKFVTLEHQIFNQTNTLLGKGKQTLFFVNQKDHHILDLPPEVYRSFLPYV